MPAGKALSLAQMYRRFSPAGRPAGRSVRLDGEARRFRCVAFWSEPPYPAFGGTARGVGGGFHKPPTGGGLPAAIKQHIVLAEAVRALEDDEASPPVYPTSRSCESSVRGGERVWHGGGLLPYLLARPVEAPTGVCCPS